MNMITAWSKMLKEDKEDEMWISIITSALLAMMCVNVFLTATGGKILF